MAGDFDAYRKAVDVRRGTEMLTEIYTLSLHDALPI